MNPLTFKKGRYYCIQGKRITGSKSKLNKRVELNMDTVLFFGEHAGTKVKDLFENKLHYLKWLWHEGFNLSEEVRNAINEAE